MKHKSQKMSAERARRLLVDTVIGNDWEERMLVNVTRVKGFFQNSRTEMNNYIKKVRREEWVSDESEKENNNMHMISVSENENRSVATNERSNI